MLLKQILNDAFDTTKFQKQETSICNNIMAYPDVDIVSFWNVSDKLYNFVQYKSVVKFDN